MHRVLRAATVAAAATSVSCAAEDVGAAAAVALTGEDRQEYPSKKYEDWAAAMPTSFAAYIPGSYSRFANEPAEEIEEPEGVAGSAAADVQVRSAQEPSGDLEKYMTYQKGMHLQGSHGSQGGSDYSKYYEQYMQGTQLAASSPEGVAADPPTGTACTSVEELESWREQQQAHIDKYVPAAFQHFAAAPLEAEYRENLARLSGTPQVLAARVPYSAAESNTTEQLASWLTYHKDQIQDLTPPEYRGASLAALQQDYEENVARVEGTPAPSTSSNKPEKLPFSIIWLPPEVLNTTEQLKEWRDGRAKYVKTYVPKAFWDDAMGPIDEAYEKNMERIEHVPMVPKTAAECNNTHQLEAWREKELRKLDSIPKVWRKFPAAHTEETFQKNLARIKEAEAEEKKKVFEQKAKEEKKERSEGTEERAQKRHEEWKQAKEEEAQKREEAKTAKKAEAEARKRADKEKADQEKMEKHGHKKPDEDSEDDEELLEQPAGLAAAGQQDAAKSAAALLFAVAIFAIPASLGIGVRAATRREQARDFGTPFLRLDAAP